MFMNYLTLRLPLKLFFISTLLLIGLASVSSDAESGTENRNGSGQKVADKIAQFTDDGVYNLDTEHLLAFADGYLDQNREIKALQIIENIDQDVLLSVYRLGDELIHNQPFPAEILKIDLFSKAILYKGEQIGVVHIHYEPAPKVNKIDVSNKAGHKDLNLTLEEKRWLQQHPVVRVHNEKDWAPFNFYSHNSPRGFSIDYMNLLEEKLGIKVEYRTGPTWNEFMQQIKAKELDVMLNIVKTEERQKYLLYTGAYLRNMNAIVSRIDSPIKRISELDGRTVAFAKGTFYEEVLKRDFQNIKRLPLKNAFESLKAVLVGRADAAVGEDAVLRYIINDNLLSKLHVSGEAKVGSSDLANLRIAVRDDWPLLHSAIAKAMASVTAEEISAIQQKWGSNETSASPGEVLPSSTQSLHTWFLVATVIIVVILIVIFLLRRFDYSLDKLLFQHRNMSVVIISLIMIFIVSVALITLTALQRTERQVRDDLGHTLVTVNSTVKQRVELWLDKRSHEATLLLEDKQLLPQVKALLQLPRNSSVLLHSDAQSEIRDSYHSHNKALNALDFFIIAPDAISLASLHNNNVGKPNRIMMQRPDLMARVFAGETVSIPAMLSNLAGKDATGRTVTEAASLFFALPVRDWQGNVIAALALELDPFTYLSSEAHHGRIGESGETYAFDLDGHLLSESRFSGELLPITQYYQDGDVQLSLRLLDPGGNVFEGYYPKRRPRDWELTLPVRESLDGHNGVNTDGYRDYRGVPVLGAWSWSDKLGFGLITKVDQSESMAANRHMSWLILLALGGTSFIALFLTVLTLWIGLRARAALNALVEERTEKLNKLVMVVEQCPLNIVITNIEGQIEYVNPAFTRVTGYEAKEAIGKNPRILRGEASPDMREDVRDTIMAGNTWRSKTQYKKKNGDYFWGAISIAPITNELGEMTHFVAMTEDISEANELEQEVKEVRERNELILDCAGEGIFGLDTSGKVTFYNRAAANMLGYQINELIGIDLHQAVHYAHGDGTAYDVASSPMRGTFCDGERNTIDNEVFWRQDGSSIAVEYTAVPMCKDGLLVGAVVMFKDISTRKEIEVELQTRLTELERFSKIAVGRELKMIELKKEINECYRQQGKTDKYKIVTQTRRDNVDNSISLMEGK